MKIGPKYKIARRLGAPVFEKTQTQKFTLSQAKKSGGQRNRKHMSQMTDFNKQLREKQKARYSYILTEKQFSGYVKMSLKQKTGDKAGNLFEILESRLDNIVWRAGLASTKMAGRQIVSHGHILVNGKRTTIPSRQIKTGDKITIRSQSLGKGIFTDLEKNPNKQSIPNWIEFDINKKEITLVSKPDLKKSDSLLFDLNSVLEFYSR